MKHILFICSRNRLRSPTAEAVFADYPNVTTHSAGLAPDADEILTPEHLESVDLIFVMEKKHQAKLNRNFKPYLKDIRIICLNIPDNYSYMQPELIDLLKVRITPHL